MITIKQKIFAHIEIWRLYTIIWCGLVSLAGSCITFGGLPQIKIALLAFFIPMIGWIAGLYLSDYLDKKLDSIQKSHRPIPSGRIKPNEALAIGAIFAISGLIATFLLSIYNIILVIIAAILIFLYAKLSKSRGIVGNINRGMVIVAAYLYGVFSINQPLNDIPIYIWLMTIVFLFHDTNSNLVGAIRDMEGDKKGGYITFPVKYGIKKSIILSFILTIIWLPLAVYIPYHYNFLKNDFYFIIIIDVSIVFLLYIYLFNSIKNYDKKKGLMFHEFFVVERVTLACAFIFGILNLETALMIYAVSISITIISQYLLRKQYEFVRSL